MSQESINTALQRTLFSPMTHDKLWSQFLEAISYELYNIRNKYGEIRDNWSIDSFNKEDLIRIAESFGYDPNLIIDNTFFMAKKEIEAIPYKIKEKTTYSGYSLIFQQNGLLGDTFCYYFNGDKLIKSIDYDATIKNLLNSDHFSPFIGIESIKNFSVMINSNNVMLDYLNINGKVVYDNYGVRVYSLDQKFNPYWKLDTAYKKIPTKHLGIEYYPQSWKCNYSITLGIGDEEVNEYECYFSSYNNYLNDSVQIFIDNKELKITISEIENKEYISDELGILDGDNSYYDRNSGKLTLKFNIIPNGLEISAKYDLDLFVTQDYFYYLEKGMEYNRRCPIIPHSGVFLTADISQAKGSDFYKRNSEGYTVPNLKLKAQTASSYNRNISLTEVSKLDNAMNEHGEPSGLENYKLDSSIKWFLDSEVTSDEDVVSSIKYIACGNEKLPMINDENNTIFNSKKIIAYYNFNTDDDDKYIRDASNNRLNLIVVGDTTKIKGIINKSLNFDGSVYAHSESNLTLAEDINYTLGVWFNANAQPSTTLETIFDNFIKIEYDYNNEKLVIENTEEFNCSKNTDHFLCMLFNAIDDVCTVYVDCVNIGTFSFDLGSLVTKKVYIGSDDNGDNKFYGLIDNVWIVINNITTEQMNYLYENKISLITHMGNRLGYYEIANDETYDDENYLLIQSYIKAMDITNETYNMTNFNDVDTITSQLRFYPLLKGYFALEYMNTLGKKITVKSNPKGQLYRTDTNEILSGSIDFENGVWSLDKNTIKSKSQEKIDEPKIKPDEGTYPQAFKVIDEGSENPTWYTEYDPYSSESYSQYEIIADEIVDSKATLLNTTKKYLLNGQYVYSNNDEEQYYVRVSGTNHYIKGCFINSDDDETTLYIDVTDNASTTYLSMQNLINHQNPLQSFRDLGEATGSTLYSTNVTPSTTKTQTEMYLDVKCSTSKLIKKWSGLIGGIEQFGYTLGNDTSTVYANLALNSQIIFDENEKSQISFNLSSVVEKKSDVDLSDDVSLQETVETYEGVYGIDFIKNSTQVITWNDDTHEKDPNVEIVKDTITFSYWIEGKKYTATVLGNIVSGENILNGSFNYETNVLDVTFITPINSEIVVSYQYYHSLDINSEYPIVMNYKTENAIKINEIGLEDENHELIAYMTFNDIEFHSIYDNISAMFAINKK